MTNPNRRPRGVRCRAFWQRHPAGRCNERATHGEQNGSPWLCWTHWQALNNPERREPLTLEEDERAKP